MTMDFGQILAALMSPDNGLRSRAEAEYRSQCESDADSVVDFLTDCLVLHQVLPPSGRPMTHTRRIQG